MKDDWPHRHIETYAKITPAKIDDLCSTACLKMKKHQSSPSSTMWRLCWRTFETEEWEASVTLLQISFRSIHVVTMGHLVPEWNGELCANVLVDEASKILVLTAHSEKLTWPDFFISSYCESLLFTIHKSFSHKKCSIRISRIGFDIQRASYRS